MRPISGVVHHSHVWWAEAPGDKHRPILVLTRERFIGRLNAVIVAPLTTTVRGIPTEVALDIADGMPRRCAVNFDNVFRISRARLLERITQLTPERLDLTCREYRFVVGC